MHPRAHDPIAPEIVTALKAHARRMLKSDDLVSDVIQDVMTAHWLCQDGADLSKQWLIKTVTYKSLFTLRLAHRRRHHEECAGRHSHSQHCAWPDPVETLLNNELVEKIRLFVLKFPENQRSVWILRVEENLEYEEISQKLNIPVGTVRSRLNRARNALRNHLELYIDCPLRH